MDLSTIRLGLVLTLMLAGCYALTSFPSALYIWSGQDTSVANAADFVAVIDFDEQSTTYGSILQVVHLVSDPSNGIGQANNEPHHSSISSNGRYYITGGLLSFLYDQKEVFIWEIPPNPINGPTFLCAIDVPGACTDEFQPIGDSQFIVSMMCNENASSPGDMVIIEAETCTASSLLTNASDIIDFNPHGYGILNNGSILVADYILPITLTGDDPSQIVFRNTARHFLPNGNLQRTFKFSFPGNIENSTSLGDGIGFMELKTIPNDPFGRAFVCGTNTNKIYLLGPGMPEPLPVFDASQVAEYAVLPSAGIMSIFSDGKRMVMTFQMRFIMLLDIEQPEEPKLLRTFDFCTDSAIYDMLIQIPGTESTTTFPEFCASNNNIAGTHVILHPEGESRFVVLNYFLKFGLAAFSGSRTVHVFKLNEDLSDFTYDHVFNPNFADDSRLGFESFETFHSLQAYPHHVQYLKL